MIEIIDRLETGMGNDFEEWDLLNAQKEFCALVGIEKHIPEKPQQFVSAEQKLRDLIAKHEREGLSSKQKALASKKAGDNRQAIMELKQFKLHEAEKVKYEEAL